MKVLVTGGGGFIGSHLASRLVSLGHEVRVLDNFITGRRENLGDIASEVDLHEADVRSLEAVERATEGRELVFHQAALPSVPRSLQDPLTSHAINATGTLNVLLAARDLDVRRVVFASSSSIYGSNPELPKREDMVSAPFSPYATAKLAGEGYCRSFGAGFGLETVALRYFNVFGPRQDPTSQYAAVIPNFITALLRREPPTIHGDGQQSRDFTYIDNVVEANLLALGEGATPGATYNIACGERITLLELVAALRGILGVDVEPVHDDARAGDVRHSHADISRARKELGYEPAIGLGEGLSRTAEHFRTEQTAPSGLVPTP